MDGSRGSYEQTYLDKQITAQLSQGHSISGCNIAKVKNSIWLPWGSKMDDGVCIGVQTKVIEQLLLIKFSYLGNCFMRKGCDGQKMGEKILLYWPLMTLPVNRPNAERLERRPLVPK